MTDILHPLKHPALCQAIVQRAFQCSWSAVGQQEEATLRAGYGLFQHLCTQLARQGKPTALPDVWIDAEVRRLTETQDRSQASGEEAA